MEFTLISWNVAGRRNVAKRMDALSRHTPDLIALQEITRHSGPRWRDELLRCGYKSIVSSYEHAGAGPRRYGLLCAAKTALKPLNLEPFGVPWPERLMGVEVLGDSPWVWLNTHIPPGSSNGWIKVDMLEAAQRVVRGYENSPVVLCGDFNAPQEERPDGVITWAQVIRADGSVRTKKTINRLPATRWDDAERTLFETPAELGLRDAVRACRPIPSHQYSWVLKRKGHETPRRFDHVFASDEFDPISARYLHELRTSKLSDHAAIRVAFNRKKTC